ncbi:MAG: helix-turn-helix transcriptional regulator [Pseudomonadota bacterium]
MNNQDFSHFRKELGKTQKEMAELLGTSLKAVHSYEQGWRNIPVSAERQILFLTSKKLEKIKKLSPCWKVKKCPSERKKKCPAWEFKAGTMCWFINGTICAGGVQKDWGKKMSICKKCDVFVAFLPPPGKRSKRPFSKGGKSFVPRESPSHTGKGRNSSAP